MLAFRDKPVTPAQIGQQLGAAYVLAGSLRRAGNRLRINAQLVDTRTDFPLWSERYDREMQDVFEVQDEIARKIAEALRITLTPQEQLALAAPGPETSSAVRLRPWFTFCAVDHSGGSARRLDVIRVGEIMVRGVVTQGWRLRRTSPSRRGQHCPPER